MDIFPTDIQGIIFTYKKDMELLEQQPTPCNLQQICCYDRFITERLVELLYSRVPLFEIRECIKCLLKIPAEIFVDYNTACNIFETRCKLWNLNPSSHDLIFWRESLPTILNEFLCNGNVCELYSQVNNCFTQEYMYNTRLTEPW